MDRRRLTRDFLIFAVFAALAGCASMSETAVTTVDTPQNRAHSPDNTGRVGDDVPPQTIAEFDALIERPEASIPAPDRPVPVASDNRNRDLSGEFHLSSSTGWFVLPVPRITDDLTSPESAGRVAAVAPGELHLPRIDIPPSVDRAGHAPAPGKLAVGAILKEGAVPESVEPVGVVRRPEPLRVDEPAGTSPTTSGPEPSGGDTGTDAPAAPVAVRTIPEEQEFAAGRSASAAPVSSAAEQDPGSSTRPAPQDLDTMPAASQPVRTAAADGGTVRAPAASGTDTPGPTVDTGPSEQWNSRSSLVDPGSNVVVVLPGHGWFYVGREYGAGTVDLIRKSSAGADDEFVFSLSDPGDYGLWFQREDVSTGSISNERLALSTSPGASSRVSVVRESEAVPHAGSDRVRAVAALPAVSGGEQDAPEENGITRLATAAGPPPQEPEGSEQWLARADEAFAAGDLAEAGENYARVLAAGGGDRKYIRQQLFRVAVAGRDPEALVLAVTELRNAGEFGASELAASLDATGTDDADTRYIPVLELLSTAPLSGIDEVYFRLAAALTGQGAGRDLRRARELYARIVDDFPLSRYWEESANNMQYLDRHFFDVR